MMLAQLLKAFAEKIYVFSTAYETDMGHRADECLRRLQNARLHQVRPKLFGDFEGFVDAQSLRDIHGAIFTLRRVVQLAKRRVTGARVVPSIRALAGDQIKTL